VRQDVGRKDDGRPPPDLDRRRFWSIPGASRARAGRALVSSRQLASARADALDATVREAEDRAPAPGHVRSAAKTDVFHRRLARTEREGGRGGVGERAPELAARGVEGERGGGLSDAQARENAPLGGLEEDDGAVVRARRDDAALGIARQRRHAEGLVVDVEA